MRRSKELLLALVAVVAITGLYLGVVVTIGVPQARGFLGHSLGVIGVLLMLMTETLYSLRKRALRRPWGTMLSWLQEAADPLVDLRVERPTLEERFLEITSDPKGAA